MRPIYCYRKRFSTSWLLSPKRVASLELCILVCFYFSGETPSAIKIGTFWKDTILWLSSFIELFCSCRLTNISLTLWTWSEYWYKFRPMPVKRLLYPRHMKFIVFSFPFIRSFVRTFVRTFIHSFVCSFVFPSQRQSFCIKVYKTSYFEDPLMDFVHIWHDGRYRSKVFISTIPTLGVTLGSRSQT